MKYFGEVALLFVMVALLSGLAIAADNATVPAPATETKSLCKLPSGVVINAPEASTGAQFLGYTYYYTTYYTFSYYEVYFTGYTFDYDYSYYGRKLLDAPTPAPASNAPDCCPLTDVHQGDTAATLLSTAGLPANDTAMFYALNPSLTKDQPLQAGTQVTVPCYRFSQFLKEKIQAHKNAPAPAPVHASA